MSDMDSDLTPSAPQSKEESTDNSLESVPENVEQSYQPQKENQNPSGDNIINATGGTACVPNQTYAISKPNPDMRVAILAAGWDVKELQGTPPDLDLSVFLLNAQEKTRENEDFVFYNNTSAQDDCIVHEGDNRTGVGAGDDETIQVNLREIPLNALEVKVYLTIYNPFENEHNFKMLKNVYFRIVNRESSDELLRFKLDGIIANATKQQAVIYIGKFERTMTQDWIFESHGTLEEGSLKEVAERYDIIVKQ